MESEGYSAACASSSTLAKLGYEVSKDTVAKYMPRPAGRPRPPPSQSWKTFVGNHLAGTIRDRFSDRAYRGERVRHHYRHASSLALAPSARLAQSYDALCTLCRAATPRSPYAFDLGAGTSELPAPTELADTLLRPSPIVSRSTAALGVFALSQASATDGAAALRDAWHDMVSYALSSSGNRLPHLAAYGALLLGAMMVRASAIRHQIDGGRKAIPLVIGGWGTRGKS